MRDLKFAMGRRIGHRAGHGCTDGTISV
jgi:hypothetical protein